MDDREGPYVHYLPFFGEAFANNDLSSDEYTKNGEAVDCPWCENLLQRGFRTMEDASRGWRNG